MQLPPSLRELQLDLRRRITGVGASGAKAAREGEASLPIRGDERLSPESRVRIYAEMYLVRLHDALAEDYPAVRAALGSEPFGLLVRRYLRAHPPDRPSLRDAGRHLARFLDGAPDVAGAAAAPWLAALARLEWATIDAFDAPDEPVLARSDLEGRAPEAWAELRLRPVRSLVRLLEDHEIDAPYERLRAGGEAGEVVRGRIALRVWRQKGRVFRRRMEEGESAALTRIADGSTLAELCDWLAVTARPEEGAREAAGLLELWLADGLLVREAGGEAAPSQPAEKPEQVRTGSGG